MFKHVIVGIDGGAGGRDALALARVLRAADGRLTLAYVYNGDPHVWRGSSPPWNAVEEERARELLDAARRAAGVDAQLHVHGSSSAGRGLHEIAERTGADLLVIGSSRRGLLGRVVTGDDTRQALSGAPCAVAIAPAGYGEHPSAAREIGVGYDGSPESEHALGVARGLARDLHARLSAFEAVSLPAAMFVGSVVPSEETVDELVEAARRRVATIDGVEPHAAYGRPAEELAMYSASLDLLVIGSRGYGPLGRLIHGSTAQQLARLSRCPLLVLTRAGRRADEHDVSLNGSSTAPAAAPR